MAKVSGNAIQLGDSATATQNFVLQTNLDGTAKLSRGNLGATTQDVLTVNAAGVVTLTNGLSSTSDTVAVGYSTGAGGTVTQLTSKTTAVTLNKPCGQITTHNAALAAGASIRFNLTNNVITPLDSVIVSVLGGGGNYRAAVNNIALVGGSVDLILTNTFAGSLSEAVTINFAIIKGSAS